MPNISLHDLTPEARHWISLIQAEAAFESGERLKLKDLLCGLIEIGSVRAISVLQEQRSDHDRE